MYCVKCGVKLQEGAKSCPLCQTPVLINEEITTNVTTKYSDKYPNENKHGSYLLSGIVTAIMMAFALSSLLACISTYGKVAWSGYVMLGLALVWILFVLPSWFGKWNPLIFFPIDIAAICGYLLYICLYNGKKWFMSFAFPVTMIIGAVIFVSYILYHYIKKGHLYITGGLIIFIGCSSMLIELFQHITFKTPMFMWSLYIVTAFSLIGIFLLIAAIIKPLREYLERKFFF